MIREFHQGEEMPPPKSLSAAMREKAKEKK